MASNSTTTVATLRQLVGVPIDTSPDEELVQRFCANRDEAAFAAIVRRHGGLVLDVCRSVLRNEADAEDAFQATFLTLAGNAQRIRRFGALAGWLHAVAWRISAKARRTRERRRIREGRVIVPTDRPVNDPSWGEVREAIHAEVNRLPTKFRQAIVLFYLAGRTQDEVGQALGLSTSGAKRRLERGRAILRSALDRRGFGPTVALAAAAIVLPATTSAQSAHTVELAIRFLTNRNAVPSTILSLVSSGVQPMTAKLLVGAAAFLGVATTVGLGALRPGEGNQPTRDETNPVVAQVKEDAGGPGPKSKSPPKSPAKTPPREFLPSAISQFDSLEPSERLKLVEKLSGDANPFAAVKVGDMAATVVERGSLEPANAFDIICKVKSKSPLTAPTIKWIVDDGSMVKKGDRVLELDGSGLKEQMAVETVKAKEAEAARILASENLELVKKENDVEIRLASIDVKLAELEFKDAPKDKSNAALALKVEQAELKLERAKARAKAQIVQSESEFRAKAAAYDLAVKRLEHYAAELNECVMTAPTDGIAVHYASSSSRSGTGSGLIAIGELVREGQKLLQIADLKQFVIETRIHEAVISSIRVGQAAQVRVDALPDKQLRGKVSFVSPTAAKTNWNTGDVRVYAVKIAIDDPPAGLKPNMTGSVHISIGEKKGVLQIPIKAIATIGRERVCYVKLGNELVQRKVVIGTTNSESVEIKEGLKEGEQILTEVPTTTSRP